jgi:hypothetical protein
VTTVMDLDDVLDLNDALTVVAEGRTETPK